MSQPETRYAKGPEGCVAFQVVGDGAFMDAVGSERAALFGHGIGGGQMSMLFAATYPERTSALALLDTYARLSCADLDPHVVNGLGYKHREGSRRRVPGEWRLFAAEYPRSSSALRRST